MNLQTASYILSESAEESFLGPFTFTRASPTVFDAVNFPATQSLTESVLEVHSPGETLKAMIIVSSAAVDQLGACDNGTTDPFANMQFHVTLRSWLQ